MTDDGKTTEQLKRIIQLLQEIVGQNAEIIKLLTPAPDNDITNLGGSISTPVKQTT